MNDFYCNSCDMYVERNYRVRHADSKFHIQNHKEYINKIHVRDKRRLTYIRSLRKYNDEVPSRKQVEYFNIYDELLCEINNRIYHEDTIL